MRNIMTSLRYERVKGIIEYAASIGFKDGASAVDPSIKLLEYKAAFTAKAAEMKATFAERLSRLRAHRDSIKILLDEARTRWNEYLNISKQPPAIALFLIGVFVATGVVVADAAWLSPATDALGITIRWLQFVTAFSLIAAPAILFEVSKAGLSHWSRSDKDPSGAKKWLVIVGTTAAIVFTVTLLILLGVFRANETIFAGQVNDMPKFLAENPNLTRALFAMLTLLLPLGLVVCLDVSLKKLGFAIEWRRAKRKYEQLVSANEAAAKAVTGQEELLKESLLVLEQNAAEFQECYKHNYDRGKHNGAWRKPRWIPILQTSVVFLGSLAVLTLLNLLVSLILGDSFMAVRIAIVCLVTFAVTAFAACGYWRRWTLPSDDELYTDQATLFRNVDYRPVLGGFGVAVAMPPATSALLNSATTNGKPMPSEAR